MLDLKDLLTYALGSQVPEGFVNHLVKHQEAWDEVFRAKLELYAYEFRPDLAVWEINSDEQGVLHEKRLPLLR